MIHLPELRLDHVARATITLAEPLELGDAPTGRRRIIHITGGTFVGPRFNATIIPGGADWQTVTADGTAIIDTRYAARTDNGAIVYVSTQGFRHGPPDVIARIAAGEDVPANEYYFRLTAKLETGDPALDWVNRTVFVATAARFEAAVHYDVYAVE